ncbi:MAG TPA: HEAT repeat domain-containing protein [Jatrophihabitantaceae bacterium]|nr:HEAT repeat domain-containing protein [Jatrophihabitantaceae bacterium]
MNVLPRPGGWRSRRFVFRAFPLTGEMDRLASEHGWTIADERVLDPEAGRIRRKWTAAARVSVSCLEDPPIESAYALAFGGAGEEAVAAVADVLAADPWFLTFDELLADVDAASGVRSRRVAVVRAGLGCPLEPDDRFVSRIEAAARDPHTEIREAAVWAMTHSEWPVFTGLLERIAHDSRDEYVQWLAVRALKALAGLGLEES